MHVQAKGATAAAAMSPAAPSGGVQATVSTSAAAGAAPKGAGLA